MEAVEAVATVAQKPKVYKAVITAPKKRAWSAEELAARITTKKQAERRVYNLGRMIDTHERNIKQEEIMLCKLHKERHILNNKWEL